MSQQIEPCRKSDAGAPTSINPVFKIKHHVETVLRRNQRLQCKAEAGDEGKDSLRHFLDIETMLGLGRLQEGALALRGSLGHYVTSPTDGQTAGRTKTNPT